MSSMDEINLEASSPDIWKPRYLFQRYDSASRSSSSNSSSFSSSSVGSFQQSESNRATQRRRTVSSTLNESQRYGEDSFSILTNSKRRQPVNGIANVSIQDETIDDVDACMFCSSMVYERQYYLWQSQYTKSSICSRCTNYNEGMRYISFWGTPSYETGSWRKRYRAGRSLDIDLSPLLEVLEKIDRMDTSMYSRKSITNTPGYIDQKNIKDSASLIETSATKESDQMFSRRHNRRLENRKVIEDLNEKDGKPITSRSRYHLPDQHVSNSSVHCNAEETDENELERIEVTSDDENNNNTTDTEYLVFEMSQDIEQVDLIEPLHLLHAEGQISVEPPDECKTPEKSRSVKTNKAPIPQRPDGIPSTEDISKYIKERRKSNYEEFIAGLEAISSLKRRSSTDKDLTVCLKQVQKNKRNKKYSMSVKKVEQKSNKEPGSDTITCFGEMNGNVLVDTNEEKQANWNNLHKEFYIQKSDGCRGIENENDINESRKNNRNSDTDGDESVKKLVKSYQGTIDTTTVKTLGYNRRRKPRKVTRKKQLIVSSSGSDEDQCEKQTFSDIKRRFEHPSYGETKQNGRPSNSKQASKISKGRFRSQYLKMSNQQQTSENPINNNLESDGSNDIEESSEDDSNDLYADTVSVENNDNGVETRNLIGDELIESNNSSERIGVYTASDKNRYNIERITVVALQSTGDEKNEPQTTKNKNIGAKQANGDCFEISTQDESINSHTKFLNEQDEEKTMITDDSEQVENNTSLDTFNSGYSKAYVYTYSNEEMPHIEEMGKHNRSKESRTIFEYSTFSDDVLQNEQSFRKNEIDNQVLTTRSREKKYRNVVDEAGDDNPNIERIKKKLGRKPIYEDEETNIDENDVTVMELHGSNDEEVELCWRTRGYDKDFYMSRRSVTGGEILDRYNRAMSNKRARMRTRSKILSNMVDKIMTQSEPISRRESTTSKYDMSQSAPLTRSCTRSKLQTEGNDCEDNRDGVSATALKAALDRASVCSERMSRRLKSQLNPNDSSGSSS